ncbi:hypothetical protein ACFV2X_02290 [Streptomyces sp. NPDC059679]|uniref:hypothetical protein n=1 Tax=Streptomyces sp. NPDC059679 TaxID=3346903 RepID=UPI0036A8577E
MSPERRAAHVLRGSMVMLAWAGEAAREPADLDWVVLEDEVRVDPLDPYPYVAGVEVVQQWPHAADGAARYEIWRDEEFDTGGQRAVPPRLHADCETEGQAQGKDLYDAVLLAEAHGTRLSGLSSRGRPAPDAPRAAALKCSRRTARTTHRCLHRHVSPQRGWTSRGGATGAVLCEFL